MRLIWNHLQVLCSSLFLNYCWLVCIIFIGSVLIFPESFPQVWLEIASGTYPSHTHGLTTPKGLWKVVMRVTVFVIVHVAINTLIGFKASPWVFKFEAVYSSVGPKVANSHRVNPSQLFSKWYKYFQQEVIFFVVVYALIILLLLIKDSSQGSQSTIGSIPWFLFVFHFKNVGDIFMITNYCLFYSLPRRQ